MPVRRVFRAGHGVVHAYLGHFLILILLFFLLFVVVVIIIHDGILDHLALALVGRRGDRRGLTTVGGSPK